MLATLLVEGEVCPNQAFKIGNCSYGFQFHLELDSINLDIWSDEFQYGEMDSYARHRPQFTDGFFHEMRSRFPLLVKHSADFCAEVAGNWLKLSMAGETIGTS